MEGLQLQQIVLQLKMIDKKNFRTGAEIVLVLSFMLSLGVNISDKDEGYIPYSCDSETIPDRMCYKLSRVGVTGVQRNCYYDRDNSKKYKICSVGWEKILNVDDYINTCPKVRVVAYTDNGKYYCQSEDGDAVCVNAKLEQITYSDII